MHCSLRDFQRSCSRKKVHATRDEAFRVLLRIRTQNPSDKWLMPYPCRYASHWHLGHLPKRVRGMVNTQRPRSSKDTRTRRKRFDTRVIRVRVR
jgi:hypothetical protein